MPTKVGQLIATILQSITARHVDRYSRQSVTCGTQMSGACDTLPAGGHVVFWALTLYSAPQWCARASAPKEGGINKFKYYQCNVIVVQQMLIAYLSMNRALDIKIVKKLC